MEANLIGQRVRVHFNLHTHLWSVTAREGASRGRVIAHLDQVALASCKFIVSAAGRERVLRDKCRAVHAWVEGVVVPNSEPAADAAGFTYNPYRAAVFTRRDNHEAITEAAAVWFAGKNAFAKENN